MSEHSGRRPDGSKNRHGARGQKAGAAPPVYPRARPLPVAPGYLRKEEGHIRGASDSFGDFVLTSFEKLSALALTELEEQDAAGIRRPFDSSASAAVSLPATVLFHITGASVSDSDGGAAFLKMAAECQAAGPPAVTPATRAGLRDALSARVQDLAQEADEEIAKSEETGSFESFALGFFLTVEEAGRLLHVRLEFLPPSPFPEHAGNIPGLS